MAISDELRAQILRYHFVERWRVGTIASQLRVHHYTVERVLSEAGVERERQRRRRASKLDPYRAFITETLERFPTLTAARLFDMVKVNGLRAREVAALTLDDIDWEREHLFVPERKGGHCTANRRILASATPLMYYRSPGKKSHGGPLQHQDEDRDRHRHGLPRMTRSTRVGVEVGGTFTDLVAFEAGGVRVAKVPSTPSAPHRGAIAALDASGLALNAAGDLVHGSTVATNAVLERKGARVAFLATEGFRDILSLQRQSRRSIYDIHYRKPAPVVARRDTFEIPERIGPHGEVVTALDEAAAEDRIRRALEGADYESVAICFLNSYANPDHERRVAALIAARFPGIGVTCSCDVTREFREYERASTTVLAAYVQPVIDRYLKEFERELAARSFTGRFSLMQSNGGRLPASGMADNAITALFSGPAAGVMGAIRQAERSGYRDLITFDMGGTSTDVCLVRDGVPVLTSDAEIDGLPIRTPVLDIVTVGAGGGSIVWRDDGGMLRVGPRSAGAEPGPACYRRGGVDPTITDAHIVRGTVLADTFLGGRMDVDSELARESFGALSEQFDGGVERIADDAVRVAEHNIVRAIQLVSTERGRDPRDYVLVPFGGAGPLHAARVAEVLSIGTIVIPPAAGVLSAFGLVASDFVRYDSRTVRFPIDEDGAAERVREQFAEMRAGAVAAFAELGITSALRFTHTLEMRYVGQAFEVPVALGEDEIAALDEAALRERFNDAHHRIFEFDDSRTNRPEVVSFRLGIASPPPSVPELVETDGEPFSDTVAIFDAGERRVARRVNRRALLESGQCEGPLLIGDDTSTAYVPPGWRARVDAHHNVIVTTGAGDGEHEDPSDR